MDVKTQTFRQFNGILIIWKPINCFLSFRDEKNLSLHTAYFERDEFTKKTDYSYQKKTAHIPWTRREKKLYNTEPRCGVGKSGERLSEDLLAGPETKDCGQT